MGNQKKGINLNDNMLVKIDVQGYEDRVIRGGQDTISRAEIVIVETSFQCLYEGQPMFEYIYEVLTKMGFSYRGALEQISNPIDGGILQADSLFVKDKGKNMVNCDNGKNSVSVSTCDG